MCGFAGSIGIVNSPKDTIKIVSEMNDAIMHRGPDDFGYWHDSSQEFFVGHRRLSIIDTSSACHQPMSSSNNRFVIVFNGEIYNHNYLRREIEQETNKCSWIGHSDTETLLEAIQLWGFENTLKKSIGMFAIALWDKKYSKLYLARDRMGEKPLYYGWVKKNSKKFFLFSSELKAITKHPFMEKKIDRDSLCLLLRHNYIPDPYSIYKNIFKLRPGSFTCVSYKSGKVIEKNYWDSIETAIKGTRNKFIEKPLQLTEKLENLLKDSVGLQMESDVPLGAFLSGGIDSSLIVSLMQAQSSKPVKTFTIGFYEDEYNEAVFAKKVAEHLGTSHTELYITPQEAIDVIPKLPYLYCEPFSDSSQIPTFLVSSLARSNVTVSLSGDAGDELFSGYNRYLITNNLWNKLSYVPRPIKGFISKIIKKIPPEKIDKSLRMIPINFKYKNLGDKFHKGGDALSTNSIDELYLRLVSQESNPERFVIDGKEPSTEINNVRGSLSKLQDIEKMMLLDSITYLPGDILTKVDRASMGVSLESRVPFLDHRVYEFAWRLPLEMKINKGVTKWILREILKKYVPENLIERPKMGFGVPLHEWIRGPLRDWAENLIDKKRLDEEGYFNSAEVRKVWEDHISGKQNKISILWSILMFQAWLDTN